MVRFEPLDFRGPPPMGISMAGSTRNVVSEVRKLLEAENPRSYCDACLAFCFDVSLEQARAAARALGGEPGFSRRDGTCDNCSRAIETTARTVKLRPPSTTR